MDNFSDEDEDKRNEKKLKRLTNLGSGINLNDYEIDGLDDESEISSIESEGEDGKIISKREKSKKLTSLLAKDGNMEKYEDVVKST